MPSILTRDGFVTEVCDIVGKSVSGLAVSGSDLQTRVRTYLNWAQDRIARFHSFHELNVITGAATVIDTRSYPLTTGSNNLGLTQPKDIGSIILLDSQNSRRLIRYSRVGFEKRFPLPTNYASGRPSIYYRVGNAVELFRIPDAVYSLRIVYPQWPTPFTTAGQLSDFDSKDQLLLTATVMETYLALEEYSDAAIWFNKLVGMLNDAVKAEGDVDWEPEAEPYNSGRDTVVSGTPWLEPGSMSGDPLYGYPEG